MANGKIKVSYQQKNKLKSFMKIRQAIKKRRWPKKNYLVAGAVVILTAIAGVMLAGKPAMIFLNRSGNAANSVARKKLTGARPIFLAQLSANDYDALKQDIVRKFSGEKPKEWGRAVAGVKRTLDTNEKVVALTFDACGGRNGDGYDSKLVSYLEANKIPATLFISGKWIDANPAIFGELAKNPLFEIENHGTDHLPCSVSGKTVYREKGTSSPGEVVDEIELNARKIESVTGFKPKYYRSATDYADDVCVMIANELGYQVVNYSVIGDGGSSFAKEQVETALLKVKPGAIVSFHMNQPKAHGKFKAGTADGLALGIPKLEKEGYKFVKLSDYGLN
jgi:peptidoglycan/xylan/chitin deacetylase (PgdA/CDA1 family)